MYLQNNIGLHYGYWLHDWECNLLKIIDKINKIGFTAIEIDSDVMLARSNKKREKISKKIEKNNLSLNYCIGMKGKYDLSSNNLKVRKRGIEHVKEIIKMVNTMGSDTISGVCYGEWSPDFKKAKNKEEYLKRSIDSVGEIVNFAERYNINNNLEPVNRYEQFMINTCREALNYIEEIDSPNFNVLLDTFHMNIEEDNMGKAIREAGEKLGYLHIGENNRKPPGEANTIDWDEVINALKEINYKGDIVMEPFINYGGEIGFDTRLWRNMDEESKSLEDRITDSLNFIKDKLNK